MNRNQRILCILGIDTGVFVCAAWLSLFFLRPYVLFSSRSIALSVFVAALFYMSIGAYLRIFTKMNHFASLKEFLHLASVIAFSFTFSSFLSFISIREMSFRYTVLHYLFTSVGILGSRVLIRLFFEYFYRKSHLKKDNKPVRTLVVGAGNGGNLFIRSLMNSSHALNVCGIVDDDRNKQGFSLYGIKVLGQLKDIPWLVEQLQIEQVTIAIPSLPPSKVEDIIDLCNESNVAFNQMPYLEEFLQGKEPALSVRDINVVDLLGREEVTLDMAGISARIEGQTIVVSGAGGSIGSEIVRQLSLFKPKRLVLLGHGENSIYHIHKEMMEKKNTFTEYIPVIGDVQDRVRMESVMDTYRPDFVFHAAAHKHVPLMECNAHEALKNNVLGTKSIAEAAKKYNVGTFVMVSSDKAVNPTNVMGASKRIAELYITGLNETGKTRFTAVRFGNVLGSRGSVVPLFQEQIKKGGPVTVTDVRMTRFFMTIPEASRLVIQAGVLSEGGEVFVLDMGKPVKIVDLAKKVVKLSGYSEVNMPIIETGIRPGEKLYEELLVNGERTDRKVYDKIFVGTTRQVPLSVLNKELTRWMQLSSEDLRNEWLAYTNEEETNKGDTVDNHADQSAQAVTATRESPESEAAVVPQLQGGYVPV